LGSNCYIGLIADHICVFRKQSFMFLTGRKDMKKKVAFGAYFARSDFEFAGLIFAFAILTIRQACLFGSTGHFVFQSL